ncbi:restriction endonuclease subunit S [Sodaliphilus pleomorphus]|uniref:restriction endonuclease subunit S n=1 Tax=Sodaliphilus pleomorphus TaxID=2606626 RepID=UPI0024094359|nr:restriction endonuclease subunit S [Sodaliphilus pleomorphus]MDD6686380.1 restriction endonuclease subunit S [Sodaliphilus pleomorphus]
MNGKQLKNSILQWAIQGKLVPQDPNDEPASVLLEKIRQEKEHLIKEKKIKRDKNASIIYRGEDNSYYEKILATGEVKCIDKEIPFDIPKGWEWCRLKHICSMQAGKNISANKIFSDKSDSHPYRCVGGNGLRGYTENFNSHGHYSIIGRQGALCGCVNIEKGKFYATEHAVVVDTYEILSPLFMYYFLTALNLNKYATATAQPGLAVSNVLEVMCPLPPLNEGMRITEKLSLLIPLIENYNVIQEKQDILNDSIKEQLKKSVLQEAIQGKLVPQLAEEGTAQELLEQIKAEKEKLVKEGKLKKSALNDSVIFKGDDNKYYENDGKNVVCIDDEIPFEIPKGWEWCRLSALTTRFSTGPFGTMLHKEDYTDNGVAVINPANIINHKISLNNIKQISLAKAKELQGYAVCKGDIILARRGDLRKSAIITDFEDSCIAGTGSFIFHLLGIVNSFFILFYSSPYVQDYLITDSIGTTMNNLNQKLLSRLLIPIPPLAEQVRIVEKIKEVTSIMSR